MAKKAKKAAKKPAKKVAKKAAGKAAKKVATKPAPKKAVRKGAKKIDPIARGKYTAVNAMLTVKDVNAAIAFCQKGLGFKVRDVMKGPDGATLHAELRLRDSVVMLGPESAEQGSFSAKTLGNTPATLYVLVPDVDGCFSQAIGAGAQPAMPVMDMFWGDRCGAIVDPDGNKWMLATHKAEPTRAQMEKALRAMMSQAQPPAGSGATPSGSDAESEF